MFCFHLGHFNNDYQNYNSSCQDYDNYLQNNLPYYNSTDKQTKIDRNIYETDLLPNQMIQEYNKIEIPTPPSQSVCSSESPQPHQILAQGIII